MTPRGHRLWTEKEDAIVRGFYPDYRALRRRLRRRTYDALRHRVRVLGIQRRKHPWTGTEIARLRKLYPVASRDQMSAAFPNRTWAAIKTMAISRKIRRLQKPFAKTGSPALDQIRQRCAELNFSMGDLDKMARTRGYFSHARWLRTKKPSQIAIIKAIRALDGVIDIRWQ